MIKKEEHMNKRIEQLAEQCGFRSNPDVYDRNQSFDIEKFAELIVRECTQIVTDAVDHREPASTYAGKIQKHFGIK
jgi:hypothetical protein